MKHLVWLVCFTAKLSAVTLLVVVLLGSSSAGAQGSDGYVVTNRHGVVKHSTLRDCAKTQSVPCSLFGGLDSGWLDSSYQWHSVWTVKPSGRWHWATKAERVRFGLTMLNQVQRRHGVVTWFRGPTGETWANVPGTNSEHWPEGQVPQ